MNLAEQYIKDVMDGNILVGKPIRDLVVRHLDDLANPDLPFHFDKEYAWHKVKGLRKWRHSQGKMAGKRFDIQPWQAFGWYLLYGWLDENDYRRFRTWYLSVARKNGKTEMLATTANEELITTPSYAPEIYSSATKKDQAKKTFAQAKLQIKQSMQYSSKLRNKINHQHMTYRIVNLENEGFFEYTSSDADKMDSLNPQMSVIDEYHAHNNTDVLDVMESGMGAREEPLLAITTTAGKGKSVDGPCFKLESNYKRMLNGEFRDDRALPMIYCLDPEDIENDPDGWIDNEELWVKPNPNIDVSLQREFLRNRVTQSKTQGIAKEIDVKTKNFNLWVRATINGFIPDNLWMAHQHEFNEEILHGKECAVGLDIGGFSDFTAYTLYFPDVDGEEYFLFRPYVDEKTAEERTRNSPINFLEWQRDGVIKIIQPGDDRPVIRDILHDAEKFNILGVAYDKYKSQEIIRAVEDEGVECHALSQSFAGMSPPTTELFKRFHEGRVIQHGKHPVARWQNGNAVLQVDANENLKVHKGKSMDKVDVIVSMIMAYAMYQQIEHLREYSYLNDHELIKV